MDAERCPKCGRELVDRCTVPGCKAPVEVYSRVVGYLRPTSTWNAGKQAEFVDRKTFQIGNGDHQDVSD